MTGGAFRERWEAFSRSRRGRYTIRAVRAAVTVAVIVYLGKKLVEMRWQDILTSLPADPLFYLFGLIVYVSIPLSDIVIYRLAWGRWLWFGLPAFIKKRIYNQDVLGYSGEVFFVSWAQKNADQSTSAILRSVRDINILSSVASTFIALALIALFLFIGQIRLADFFDRKSIIVALAVTGGAVLLLPVAIRFRRYLFSMPARPAACVFGVQCVRLLLGQVLRIGQWSVAMPETPLEIWFSLAAASLIISRIPVVPSQDLIFLGIGVEMSSMLGISEASMFSMLAVSSAIDKLLNLGLFLFFSVKGRSTKT